MQTDPTRDGGRPASAKAPRQLRPLCRTDISLSTQDEYELLSLCHSKGYRIYMPVPPGHHVVAFPDREPAPRPLATHCVLNDVRYLQVEPIELLAIRDVTFAVVSKFYEGGLAHRAEGLSFERFASAVLQREVSGKADSFMCPVNQRVTAKDLLISHADWLDLISIHDQVDDRWGHRERAPSVFLVRRAAYRAARFGWSHEDISQWLMQNDEHRVFKVKIADFAARLIKKGVVLKSRHRMPVILPEDLLFENAMGRDYREDIASTRLAFLHLATDYWLHDQEHPNGERFLPSEGLQALLKELGFRDGDGKETQVEFLRRIIQNQPSRSHLHSRKTRDDPAPIPGNRAFPACPAPEGMMGRTRTSPAPPSV